MPPYLDMIRKSKLLEVFPDPTVVCNLEGRILEYNEIMYKDMRVSYSRNDILERNIFEFVAERDRERAYAEFEEDIRTHTGVPQQYAIKRGDGTEFTAQVSAKVVMDEGAAFYIITIRDLTQILSVEAMVREAHDKLEATVNAIPDILFETDEEGRIHDCHLPSSRTLILKQEEVLGRKVSELLPSEASQTILNAIAEAKSRGWHTGSTYFIDRPAGRQWFELAVQRKGKGNSDNERFVLLARDVTNRKKMEEELRESEARFRAAFDQAGLSMAIANLDGILIKVNDAYCKMLGYPREELIGKDLIRFTHPDDAKITFESFNLLKKKEKNVHQYEKRFIKKDGKQIFVFVSIAALQDSGGNPMHVLAQIQDVTERKSMEEELRRHTEHLQERVDEKTRQLQDAQRLATIGETATMVGHDLRNPLQAIVNAIYIMDEELNEAPPFPEKAKFAEGHRVIKRNINYMNKIVADLTDFSRPLVPDLTDAPVIEITKEVLSSISMPDNIEVRLSFDKKLRAKFDYSMMKRILTNLIMNAVQAMPEGGCLEIGALEKGGKLAITVADTGMGISKEVAETLFTPLRSHKSKGMGMGLAVVKRMVEAHGGSIAYKTAKGKGTTFFIDMPQGGTNV